MNEEQRKEVIPELDQLLASASELAKEIDYFRSKLDLYKDESLSLIVSNASGLIRSLRDTSDALKREGTPWIQSYVTEWHHFRTDNRDVPDPAFETIAYDGNDTWTIIMTTTTHGREHVVVHSNAATWEQVYSADSE